MKTKKPRFERGFLHPSVKLIIVRQKHGGHAPVGFGDNPELHALAVVIRGEELSAELKRLLVRAPVLGAKVAPIAAQVAIDAIVDVLGVKVGLGVRCHEEPSEPKFRFRLKRHVFYVCHVMLVKADNGQ